MRGTGKLHFQKVNLYNQIRWNLIQSNLHQAIIQPTHKTSQICPSVLNHLPEWKHTQLTFGASTTCCLVHLTKCAKAQFASLDCCCARDHWFIACCDILSGFCRPYFGCGAQYTLAVIYVLLWQCSSSAVILCNVALDHNPEEDQTSEPAPPPPGGWAAQSFINRSESRSLFVRPSVAVMRQPAQMHGNSLLWKTTSHPDKELA